MLYLKSAPMFKSACLTCNMWLTSKMEQCSLVCMWEAMWLSLYWTGILQPANSTIFPPCPLWKSNSGVFFKAVWGKENIRLVVKVHRWNTVTAEFLHAIKSISVSKRFSSLACSANNTVSRNIITTHLWLIDSSADRPLSRALFSLTFEPAEGGLISHSNALWDRVCLHLSKLSTVSRYCKQTEGMWLLWLQTHILLSRCGFILLCTWKWKNKTDPILINCFDPNPLCIQTYKSIGMSWRSKKMDERVSWPCVKPCWQYCRVSPSWF